MVKEFLNSGRRRISKESLTVRRTGSLAIRLEGVRCPKEYIIARRATYGEGVSKFKQVFRNILNICEVQRDT